jgi:hypothetical protein
MKKKSNIPVFIAEIKGEMVKLKKLKRCKASGHLQANQPRVRGTACF